ncbi:MAG: tetratricopeptide repeat protein [Saprospiraceae bacterium]|nr:tetratricopeptide repeat protein [Saprospiraceae bacterium]
MEALKFLRQLLAVILFCLAGNTMVWGQSGPIETARPLIAAKQYNEAIAVYENWLAIYPNDANIWRELGIVQSWNGQSLKGIDAFKKSLGIDPGNLDAKRSLGYAYAWRGDYGHAKEMFESVLEASTNDEEAQKGLAYLALWSGNYARAANQFSELARRSPQNTEYQIALAKSYKAIGETGKAARAYRQIKQLDPANKATAGELVALRTQPVFAEADIWAGYSKVASSSSDGLRLMQLALQLRHNLRVYGRFDKSLSVDNLDLLRRNVRGNVYNLGAYYNWNDKTGTTIEAGLREFGEAQPEQYTIRAEQNYAIGKNVCLKGGLMTAFAKDTRSEWVIFAGGQISVARWLTLEPAFFFTRLNAYSFDHRFALNSKFLPGKGYEINIGVLAGRAQIENEAAMRELTGAYVVGLAPISKPVWLMFSYRYENGFFDKLSTAALGLRFRFGESR